MLTVGPNGKGSDGGADASFSSAFIFNLSLIVSPINIKQTNAILPINMFSNLLRSFSDLWFTRQYDIKFRALSGGRKADFSPHILNDSAGNGQS